MTDDLLEFVVLGRKVCGIFLPLTKFPFCWSTSLVPLIPQGVSGVSLVSYMHSRTPYILCIVHGGWLLLAGCDWAWNPGIWP